MKKLIIPLLVILVFGMAIYIVVSYNKNKYKDIGISNKKKTLPLSGILPQ